MHTRSQKLHISNSYFKFSRPQNPIVPSVTKKKKKERKAHTTSYNRVPFSANLFPLPSLLSTISSKKSPVAKNKKQIHALSPPDHWFNFYCRRDRDTGGVLRPDSDRCPDRDLLLLAGSRLRFRFLVLPEATGRALSGTIGAAATVEPVDGELRVPGVQQQIHQPCAERAP